MANDIKDIQEILSLNKDLKGRVESENWDLSYNKKADMIIMGGKFPVGTFYHPVGDTRVLLRVDANKKIYGFAIENAKVFIKENPEIGVVLSFLIHPMRSILFKLPYYIISYHAAKGMDSLRAIFSVSNYIAGNTAFAR